VIGWLFRGALVPAGMDQQGRGLVVPARNVRLAEEGAAAPETPAE
jgi:hypothetical protein